MLTIKNQVMSFKVLVVAQKLFSIYLDSILRSAVMIWKLVKHLNANVIVMLICHHFKNVLLEVEILTDWNTEERLICRSAATATFFICGLSLNA